MRNKSEKAFTFSRHIPHLSTYDLINYQNMSFDVFKLLVLQKDVNSEIEQTV